MEHDQRLEWPDSSKRWAACRKRPVGLGAAECTGDEIESIAGDGGAAGKREDNPADKVVEAGGGEGARGSTGLRLGAAGREAGKRAAGIGTEEVSTSIAGAGRAGEEATCAGDIAGADKAAAGIIGAMATMATDG